MRGYGFSYGDIASYTGPLVIRTFDVGKGQAAEDRQLALESPALLVISTPADNPDHWASPGRALTTTLLRIASHGLVASYLNQPIELPELRPEVARLVGTDGCPQRLLKVGRATQHQPHTSRIPRRPTDDLTEHQDPGLRQSAQHGAEPRKALTTVPDRLAG